MLKCVIYFALINLYYVECSTTPLIHIDNEDFKGSLEGVEKLNIFNEAFTAFLGIPYAKPPVGELRFKDPQRLQRYEGTLDGKHEGFECYSITAKNASEDCLNLNVYTKMLSPSKPLPVLVMIHPGGLYLGSAQWMDPSYWLTKDIVLITFNYRLGSLGFLNLGTEKIPGNAGFKDQVYALRWIQRNIANFGGNPQDITLMGYSAGAMSVSLHLVSPMSKGLFHKAIAMSGSMPPQMTKSAKGDQKYLAVRQAKRLNCSKFQNFKDMQWSLEGQADPSYENLSEEDVVSCLNQFSGLEISNSLRKMFEFGKDNPIYLWLPLGEKDFGQERYLIDDFYESLNNARKIEIPLLMGYTNGEFCTSSADILKNESLRQDFESQFLSLAPRIFGYENWPKQKDVGQALLQHYFNGSSEFDIQVHDALCDLFSDALIRYGAHRTAEMVSQKGLVYFYEFVYQGASGEEDKMFPQKKDRVEHMDDLQYLFNWSHKKNPVEDEIRMVKLYTDFMYDFILNGKISSPKAKPYPMGYALLANEIQYIKGRNFDNFQFWMDLFKDEK